MTTDHILVTEDKQIIELRFNRPEKKNAITDAMYLKLAEGLEQANQNDDIRVVKITGSEQSFCAGNDLKDFLQNPPSSNDSAVWRFLSALSSCQKPMIAGVNGPAVGVGTTLLLHCDLVVASDSAVFALPFTSLGLCPEAGSSLLLPLQCGAKKAAEWLLLGERFNAQQACEAGLINKSVATADEVNEQLERWTKQLCRLPKDAVLTTRRLLGDGIQQAAQARIAQEGEEFKRLLLSDDAKAAFNAFLNK